jgi:O-antigen/teichoic acid export membrane protein
MPRLPSLRGAGPAVASARIFSLACAAAQLPILTNYLSPEEFAIVAVSMAAAGYFLLLGAEPWVLGFQRFPGSSANRSNYTFTAVRTGSSLLVFGLIAIAASVALDYELEVLALTCWGVGLAVNRLVSCAWLMWHEPWKYAQNLMVGTGARSATLIVLIVLGSDPLVSLAVAGILSALAALAISPRLVDVRPSLRSSPWPFKFGLGLAIASAGYTVLTNSTLLLISTTVPLDDVAAFAALSQVATLTSGAVLGLVATVLYPRMRSAWDLGQEMRVRQSVKLFHLWCVAVAYLAIGVATTGDAAALNSILPDTYANPNVVGVLILGLALGSMGQASSWILQFRLDVRTVLVITTGAATASALGAVLLSREFGLIGGTVAFAAGFFLYFVLMEVKAANPSAMSIVASASLVVFAGAAVLGHASALGPPAVITGLALALSAGKKGLDAERTV